MSAVRFCVQVQWSRSAVRFCVQVQAILPHACKAQPADSLDEALIVARVVTGYSPVITSEQFAAVDMDFDGVLTMTDISLIMRRTCGLQ